MSRLLTIAAAAVLAVAPAAFTPRVVLYDAALGTRPEEQGRLYYLALPPPVESIARYEGGATTLDTTADLAEAAGYFNAQPPFFPPLGPTLDRDIGFTLRFRAQLVAEQHTSDDRAGLSVTLLGSDQRGIELGFWPDRIWAQDDGAALFTQAEGAAADTTAMATYALTVRGDRYTLQRDGVALLSGPVRDYTPFEPPTGLPDPYENADFVFLGDNSESAAARVRLESVVIEIGTRSFLPLIRAPALV